jgi:tetratricopeptide (TPR) repeat protein
VSAESPVDAKLLFYIKGKSVMKNSEFIDSMTGWAKITDILLMLCFIVFCYFGTATFDNFTLFIAALVDPSITVQYISPNLGLYEAIEQAAEKIAQEVPAGTRIAVVNIRSESVNISEYIIEELAGALDNNSLEVADRNSLDYIRKELNFQMSGNVSDETAQSVGEFVGAQFVVSGYFTRDGNAYRLIVNALNTVENTIRVPVDLTIRNDANFVKLLADINANKINTHTNNYGIKENVQPNSAGGFLDRGIWLMVNRDFEMAITCFSDAIILDPSFVSAWLLRGRAIYASVTYITSVDTKTGQVGSILNTSFSKEKNIVYDRAIADYTETLRLSPKYTLVYIERGITYNNKGEYDQSIEDCTQALRLDPSYAYAYLIRGIAYAGKKDYDHAIADYDQVIQLNPNYAVAYMNRGNAYAGKKDYDQAIADYDESIKCDPNNALTYSNRGITYADKKDYDRAIADYDLAIKLDPNYAGTYSNRGSAYDGKGDYDRAAADYEKALQIDPTLQWVK